MLWSDFERASKAWDPWRELERIRLKASDAASSFSGDEFPAFNIWTNGNGAIVTSEIPGVDPASVDISVAGRTLTLAGSRTADAAAEGDSYHRRERWQGRFSRAIELPFLIESNKVEARFDRGVLHVDIPRAEADKPKKITVKVE